MKTTNNVQKATLRFTTIIASLILISFTVSAQNFLKELSGNQHGELIFAYADLSMESKTVVSNDNISSAPFSELVKESAEDGLELEEWMMNETYFSGATFYFEETIENPLDLENWMTNDNYFYQNNTDARLIYENEEEKVLDLENWMLDNNTWNI